MTSARAFEVLFEEEASDVLSLPSELEDTYGGPFTLADEIVYGNFVEFRSTGSPRSRA